jgi:hypothetical protein
MQVRVRLTSFRQHRLRIIEYSHARCSTGISFSKSGHDLLESTGRILINLEDIYRHVNAIVLALNCKHKMVCILSLAKFIAYWTSSLMRS